MPDSVLIAEDLVTWPADEPQLIGARCSKCGVLTFPNSAGCPRCGSDQTESALLPPTGTLWTWTSQEFLPKEPYIGTETVEAFVPWYVGLVELGGEIRVEGRLVDCTQEDLVIGMPMRTVVVPFAQDKDGNDVLTFAFSPTQVGAAADPTVQGEAE